MGFFVSYDFAGLLRWNASFERLPEHRMERHFNILQFSHGRARADLVSSDERIVLNAALEGERHCSTGAVEQVQLYRPHPKRTPCLQI